MRRYLAIALVAMLLVVLPATTAFASACSGVPCDAMQAAAAAHDCCAPVAVQPSCGSSAPASSLNATCDMHPERRSVDESSSVRTAPEPSPALVADVLAPAIVFGRSAVPAPVPVDARGAPHLTTVIRI